MASGDSWTRATIRRSHRGNASPCPNRAARPSPHAAAKGKTAPQRTAEVNWYIRCLHAVLGLVGALPMAVLHRLGAGLGWLLFHVPNPMRHNARVTLSLIPITQFGGETRHSLLQGALREAGKSAFETCRIWSSPRERSLSLIREIRGGELFDRALGCGRGLIVAAPHLGCWELLNFWLGSRIPTAIAYRPPRQPALEPLLRQARSSAGCEQVRADGVAGVRTLYRRLAAGGVVGILPDQQPKLGEGEFAPFFGTPALTMVLLTRLAQRTGAVVLFAFAERLPRAAGYRLHFLEAPADIASPDLPTAVAALNCGIENCVRLAPAQYQWHYKRYKIRPPGDARRLYRALR
jgi:KDO2-lipid IV(A) lauroyltransferase